MRGFNEARRLWIVVENLTELANRDLEDSIADKGLRPGGVEQLLFGDKLAWTLEEIIQGGKSLRSELYCL